MQGKSVIVFVMLLCLLAAGVLGSAAAEPTGTIAFYRHMGGGNRHIYTIKADGSELNYVIGYPDLPSASRPCWSPYGEFLAFDGGAANACDIWLIRPDGSDLFNVTGNGMNALAPDFSPDGSQIAFNTPYVLYTINVDGTGRTSTGSGVHPKWSPDGTLILYSNWGTSYDSDLFLLDLITGTVVQLTNTPGVAEIFGDWSPDGTQIAFYATEGGEPTGDIWVMNADGTGRVKLTASWAGHARYGAPAWSPDGNYIAFASDYDEAIDIWIMEADGSNPFNLTSSEWDDYSPSWTAYPLQAEVDIDPDTLNLRSRGRPITAYIELPEGYDVADIDVDSICLYFEGAPEEGIPVDSRYRARIGDEDGDEMPDLMVKFNRQLVQSYLEPGMVEMAILGELTDGTLLEGSDTVRVINPGRRRPGHPLFRRK